MFRTLIQAFTSPIAGPAGFALALALCAMLITTVFAAEREEAALHGRIAALTAENQRVGLALHARLAACEGGPAEQARSRATNLSLSAEQRAQRLSGEPAGFDVCARMESADRKVLENLK